MAQPPPVGDLELEHDLAHQRHEWRAERVAWIVIGLVLVAALAGLLGRGPLSNATRSDPSGVVQVHYQRFARHGAVTELEFTVAPDVVREGQLQLRLDRDYIAGVRIQAVEPEPQSVAVAAGHLTYTFQAEAGERPLRVIFQVEPIHNGSLPLAAAVGDRQELSARQWVYP